MDKKEIEKIKAEARKENARKAGEASRDKVPKEVRVANGKKGAEKRWENWREANL